MGLATFWLIPYSIFGVWDIFEEIETYSDKRIPWWEWLLPFVTYLSAPVFLIAASTGWLAGRPPVRESPQVRQPSRADAYPLTNN